MECVYCEEAAGGGERNAGGGFERGKGKEESGELVLGVLWGVREDLWEGVEGAREDWEVGGGG